MTLATPAGAVARPGRHDHIVDRLIAERAPKLAASPLWPVTRPLLYALLDYAKARRMADAIASLPGRAALDHISELLSLKVAVTGLDRVPTTGRLVVICNHPTGIADGIAVFDALKAIRQDICFYANADAHRVSPRFDEILIPVEWVEAKRTREKTRNTLTLTREALEAERCLVIFPAGKLARRQPDGRLAESDWMPSAVSIARKYEAPVLPIQVEGPWSTLFHFFHGFSGELRDITLFHELLNKQGREFHLTIGRPIPAVALDGDPIEVTARLKAHVEHGLAADPDRIFA
ncbi:MAG: 1-acyl-sn-glycerol-3-phosphate acyltransferase [Alphaproteobacteria bacterium]|nr:1-acyl-sn-glycerol-3-phosphate acyltransferase [Alphaproteobacteria bacterium]MBU1517027.1 1-acyl-sn-glycerol-3-phosphate acyltransferase [Alphaproteobacteria bacterium]MBU2093646.1 1-acyl-sn-glycerol-3-phosphate acyltransferase [Alphaproteobacteria bacterium]MBU2152508.1 1-acyl-sn-glycerol-3-phosphate acyltransferase [Alphaproteobacteria bacterium]MBU2308754.1 1-acyl-sn-glycerol-3-phosphate acyltransferase [Alphaproteobacteria bacterium]